MQIVHTVLAALRAGQFGILEDMAGRFPEAYKSGIDDIGRDRDRIARTEKRLRHVLRHGRRMAILAAVSAALLAGTLLLVLR